MKTKDPEISELKALVQKLVKENRVLMKENERLKEELKLLRRRLGLDSTNSAKPPSSDGLRKKPVVKSLREKTNRKSGGQKGHKGVHLQQVTKADAIVKHTLDQCPKCAKDLKDAKIQGVQKRQVFDIPKAKVIVTEHQSEMKECPCCGCQSVAKFPEEVRAYAQYGANVKAFAIYLCTLQFIPEGRLNELFKDLFSLEISQATVAKMSKEFSEQVKGIQQEVGETLKQSKVKHLDETGFRIGGKTRWLHVLSNKEATHYRTSDRRKPGLGGLSNVIVHDGLKSYFKLEGVLHGLCNAHHLRELQALEELEKEPWASTMSKLLRLIGKICKEKVSKSWQDRLEEVYDKLIEIGLEYHEEQPMLECRGKRGRRKRRTGHNLLLRLQQYRESVLRCLHDSSVPFTNNQAEQDLRMMKVKQKISGGFRTLGGADIFCNTRGFLSTCRKQGIDLFDAITHTIAAKPPRFTFS